MTGRPALMEPSNRPWVALPILFLRLLCFNFTNFYTKGTCTIGPQMTYNWGSKRKFIHPCERNRSESKRNHSRAAYTPLRVKNQATGDEKRSLYTPVAALDQGLVGPHE